MVLLGIKGNVNCNNPETVAIRYSTVWQAGLRRARFSKRDLTRNYSPLVDLLTV